MKRFYALVLACFLLMILSNGVAFGLTIDGYTAEENDLYTGFPATPTPNTDPDFVGAGLDFSGVGFSGNNTNAVFCGQMMIGALHEGLPTQMAFYSPTLMETVTYYVGARLVTLTNPNTGLVSDIYVAYIYQDEARTMLGYNPDHGLAVYDIASSVAVGDEIYPVGRGLNGPVVAKEEVSLLSDNETIGTRNSSVYLFDDLDEPGDAFGEAGDSGGPTFKDEGGMLALAGIHLAIGTRNDTGAAITVDLNLVDYREQLLALKVTPIPEPSRSLLALFGLIFLVGRRHRR